MIQHPERYIGEFARAGADYLTVHAEVCPHLHRTIQQIREVGVKPGVALNPSTSLHAVEHVLDQVDLVLIMSVNPGFGGQSFISFALKKIEELARWCARVQPRPEIEVDGGIKIENCGAVAKAGAEILVAGSAVFSAPDPRAAVNKLREAANSQPEHTTDRVTDHRPSGKPPHRPR